MQQQQQQHRQKAEGAQQDSKGIFSGGGDGGDLDGLLLNPKSGAARKGFWGFHVHASCCLHAFCMQVAIFMHFPIDLHQSLTIYLLFPW